MSLIAYGIFIVLQAVALVHIGWALGMSWPAQNRAALGQTVVGTPVGVAMPPMWLTIIAALAISLLGWFALWGTGWVSLGWLDAYQLWPLLAAAAVFGLRGVATYLPFGPMQALVEPFRTLDRRYFAPLCLALSAGYLVIISGL